MRTNTRPSHPARLAAEVISLQGRQACRIHARLMRAVQSCVHLHAQGNWQQPTSEKAEEKQGQQGDRTVEYACRWKLWGVGVIEEAHSRHWIQATLVQAEPQVVIGVNENASCPKPQHATTEARAQHRRRR
jgi:hypothetical protein